ncbi:MULTISPECIES: GspE/PulE family protein [unclassified Fusibacter]|uniref:GspE/PulE family protein n=1 Tax=unclassified Fusibacter TaxID=2624464 RepID=UPI0010107C73|nr:MULTISPECIES: ATPase, T2SS/T4P/T4SS family [unclassified Fusibacter]MCK8058907.1 Flp pilus assembly complex ATPase component TadA [Fusibacter sp. A2]NPE21982.1 Flp pilus assembly complex ATPase component TadA [Fusibacter sp. A1]RXV61549.1 type II secretion system protein GspE [Fusibacter sp. A1]
MIKKKRLGDILIDQGYLTLDELHEALEEQKQHNLKLGTVLLNKHLITEAQLYSVLELQFDISYVDLNSYYIDPKVPKIINESLALRHQALPIGFKNNRLVVAMADPLDMIAKDDIRIASGLELEIVISPSKDIEQLIERYYDSADDTEKAAEEYSKLIDSDGDDVVVEDEGVTNAPMVRLVNGIISQAVKSKASDIHIEPFEKQVRIRYRIDGELREIMSPGRHTHLAIVTRIKIMGKMNISERRIPQDGRVEAIIDGHPIDMRISVLPTVYGEKVVIRLLDRTNVVATKEQLGFSEHNLDRLNRVLKVPEGIILVTGPTGSGKTTTLYAILKELNRINRNIITVEDPVEYRLEGVNQVQVNNKAGLSFASGLRSILRQDPDIVMVGEIRDAETAEIAIRAAITGHIVLSTLHTNDTASSVTRLVDMGIEPFLVSTATVGILAQRLVKKICPKCTVTHEASDTERLALGLESHESVVLYKGSGCNVCNQTGYLGRTAIHEVLLVDRDIRNLITSGANSEVIKDKARQNGMLTLYDSCKDLVLQGVTSVEEMLRVTYNYEL